MTTTATIGREVAKLANQAAKSACARIETCSPGEVVSYDPQSQTATIRLVVNARRRQRDGGVTTVERPLQVRVPVVWPGNPSSGLVGTLSEGDPCLVLFTSRDASRWLTGAPAPVDPASPGRHDSNGSFALPGSFPLARVERSTDAIMTAPGVCLYGTPEAGVYLGNAAASTYAAVAEDTRAELEYLRNRLEALESEYLAHGHLLPSTVVTPPPTTALVYALTQGIFRQVGEIASSIVRLAR